MASLLGTESLARGSARRPWVVIALWVIALVVFVGLAATLLGDALTTEFHLTTDVDSVVGDRLVEERLSGPPKLSDIVIVRSDTLTVDDNAFRQEVETIHRTVVGFGDQVIESATHHYVLADESLVSADRHTTIIPFTFAIDVATAGDNVADVRDAVVAASSDERFEVLMTGQATIFDDFSTISQEDFEKGESIAIPIALLILILVFGAVVAALIPLIMAGISIAIALGIVALVGLTYQFNLFVTNITGMIGLAVGIDYSLFIVYRFRDERSGGLEKMDAIARAGATASRAVFFSGVTVVLALTGLLLVPMDVFNALAAGAIFVVSVSVLASLTLLPAVLSLLGDKINKLSVPIIGAQKRVDEQAIGGFWDRVSRGVMKQPVVSLLLAAGLLIAAAIPFFDLNPGFADVEAFPDELDSKKGFIIVPRSSRTS